MISNGVDVVAWANRLEGACSKGIDCGQVYVAFDFACCQECFFHSVADEGGFFGAIGHGKDGGSTATDGASKGTGFHGFLFGFDKSRDEGASCGFDDMVAEAPSKECEVLFEEGRDKGPEFAAIGDVCGEWDVFWYDGPCIACMDGDVGFDEDEMEALR
jgi:hypothetical protein